jgi:hypothetical protein
MPDVESSNTGNITDFSINGLAGIRLVDAADQDRAMVRRQLGLHPGSLAGEPDITIRFVPRLAATAPMRYLKRGAAGFTDDAFILLDNKSRLQHRSQIPFDKIGERCEIICEHGLSSIPLLTSIINLTMLNKGILPVHASAFVYNRSGVLVNGWPKGGKTGMLLAFMNRGAKYISDDWVYISSDDSRMHGLPEQIQIRDWYLQFLPQYQAVTAGRKRLKMRLLKLLHSITSKLSGSNRQGLPAKLLRRINLGVERQLSIHVHPHTLFGEESCISSGHLNKVFLAVTQEQPGIMVRPAQHQAAIRQINSQLLYEQQTLMSYYLMFRFAFPEKTNRIIDQYETLQYQLLDRILADKEIYNMYHPFDAPLPDIFTELNTLFK